MNKCKCPYCNENTISYWSKFLKLMFPKDDFLCNLCGHSFLIPRVNIFLKVTYLLAIYLISFFAYDLNIWIRIVIAVNFVFLPVLLCLLIMPIIKSNA